MNKRRGVKSFLAVCCVAALFVAGYMAMSVFTACPAEAFLCCNTQCILPFKGISFALGEIMLLTTAPALGIAAGSVAAYYAVALGAFSARALFAISMVINTWFGWWDTTWYYNLNPMLQDMTEQLVAINAEQARAIGAFTDMLDRTRAVEALRDQELRSHQQQSPGENVCVAGTVTGGLVRAQQLSQAYETAASLEALQRSAGAVGTSGAGGTARDMNVRFRNYVERYCDPNENRGYAGCTTMAPFAGQDRDVTGQIFQKDTIDLRDPDVKKTVDDLVTNLVEPFVVHPIAPTVYGSAEGQQFVMAVESYKAKRQVLYDAMYHIISRRAPGSGMGEFIREMRLEAGLDENPALLSPDYNPSRNEVMDVLTAERYRTAKYAVRQIDEPQNAEREHVIQAATQAMQLSDMLDLLDRYSLIVAARVGDRVRASAGVGGAYASAPMN